MPRSLWIGLLVLGVGGCAKAPPSLESGEGEAELVEAVNELEARKVELAGLRGAGSCPEVCKLSALICGASNRICEIAARHADSPGFTDRCRTATEDCAAARAQCEACK